MAAIDSLLRLILLRGADVLTISSGQVPVLRKAGEVAPLSMPPLEAPLVATMVDEVLDGAARDRLRGGGDAVDATHRLADGATFSLRVERQGAGYRIACCPAAASPPPAPPPPPPAAQAPIAPVIALTPAIAAAPDPELRRLLEQARHEGASDVILSAGQAPRLRIGGELLEVDAAPWSEARIRAAVAPALGPARLRELEETGSADAALELEGRHRLNVFRQAAGLAVALRPVSHEAPTLAELHLPADLHGLTGYSSGLVLITGRAGSGKSTTLVALIEQLNRTRARHVITLEDPIEHVYASKRCLIHQREVGAQVDGFARGLRAALRESPDVILVGEMRDRETIAAALTAAETGHLVLSTMHCATASVAAQRIIDVFPEGQQPQIRGQLASTLRAVLTQALVPGVAPPARFPAYEKLVVTSAVASLIREGKLHQLPTAIQTGRDDGMVPLDRTLGALVRSGAVSRAVARGFASDPASL